jgi:hypothetical protein
MGDRERSIHLGMMAIITLPRTITVTLRRTDMTLQNIMPGIAEDMMAETVVTVLGILVAAMGGYSGGDGGCGGGDGGGGGCD